MDSKFDVAKSS